MNRIKDGTLL